MNDFWMTKGGGVLHLGNQEYTWCGRSLRQAGWRRPSADELESLIDCRMCRGVKAEVLGRTALK